jgi:hypothetical protein
VRFVLENVALDRCWTGTGQVLNRYWTGVGQILGRYWVGIGQVLGRHSTGTGLVLDRYWTLFFCENSGFFLSDNSTNATKLSHATITDARPI